MSVVIVMSMSLDGYVAGSNDTPEQPLGDGGVGLHAWTSGGGPDGRARLDELRESSGAMISGRRTYDIVDGWSVSHPFGGIPLFVVSHGVPDEVPIGATPFTFVPDGVASAVEQARRAAGEKDVYVIGGASVGRASVVRTPAASGRRWGVSGYRDLDRAGSEQLGQPDDRRQHPEDPRGGIVESGWPPVEPGDHTGQSGRHGGHR